MRERIGAMIARFLVLLLLSIPTFIFADVLDLIYVDSTEIIPSTTIINAQTTPSIEITINIQNPHQKPLTFLKYQTPFDNNYASRNAIDFFAIYGETIETFPNQKSNTTAAVDIKRFPASELITIQPKESITATVSIPIRSSPRFPANGKYSVQLGFIPLYCRLGNDNPVMDQCLFNSNHVEIYINGKSTVALTKRQADNNDNMLGDSMDNLFLPLPPSSASATPPRQSSPPPPPPPQPASRFPRAANGDLLITNPNGGPPIPAGANGCSENQKRHLQTAMNYSIQYIYKAVERLKTKGNDATFKRFFGSSHTQGTVNWVHNGFLRMRQLKRWDFRCPATCNGKMGAYIVRTRDGSGRQVNPLVIHFCPVLFSARSDDSERARVVVHEASHHGNMFFSQDIAYHESQVVTLAKNRPNSAVRNADSLALYAVAVAEVSNIAAYQTRPVTRGQTRRSAPASANSSSRTQRPPSSTSSTSAPAKRPAPPPSSSVSTSR